MFVVALFGCGCHFPILVGSELALHTKEFIFLNSSDLLEHLAMLLTSILTIKL